MIAHIAFIGFGEAGAALAAGLRGEGVDAISAYDRLLDEAHTARALRQRAAQAGVVTRACARDAVAGAELVFSAVTPDQCRVAASEAAAGLRDGQTFIDINSTSPGEKRAAADIVTPTGAAYIDAAVMTNVPPHGHRVPMLLAGAQAATAAERLQALGMRVDPIGGEPGQAATVKMCRSVFVKGLDAILYESLQAATRAGVADRVLASLGDALPGFAWDSEPAARLARAAYHGRRRAAEMTQAAQTLRELGIAAHMADACARVLALMGQARTDVADLAGGDLEQILGIIAGNAPRA